MLKSLMLLCAVTMSVSSVVAANQSEVAALTWEQHPEGIAFALTYNGNAVTIRVKNTSSHSDRLLNQGANIFVLLFYLDGKGTRVLLTDPRVDDEIEKNSRTTYLDSGMVHSETVLIPVNARSQIKLYPVICRVLLEDGATGRGYTVESTPKVLVATPEK